MGMMLQSMEIPNYIFDASDAEEYIQLCSNHMHYDSTELQQQEKNIKYEAKTVQQFVYEGQTPRILTYHPTGKMIAAGLINRKVHIWNSEGSTELIFEGHQQPVNAVAFAPDNQLISGSKDQTIVLWDINAAQQKGRWWMKGPVTSVQCHADGNRILWGLSHHENEPIIEGNNETTYTPTMGIIDSRAKKVLQWSHGHVGGVYKVIFNPQQGKQHEIISLGLDGEMKVWDARKSAIALVTHATDVHGTTFAISHNGERLVIPLAEDVVCLFKWGEKSIQPEARLNLKYQESEDMPTVKAIDYSEDDQSIIIASGRTTVLWDIKTPLAEDVCYHPHPVSAIACNPCKSHEIAVATESGNNQVYGGIHIWHIKKTVTVKSLPQQYIVLGKRKLHAQ